jgi:hypothetical protein
MSDPYQQRKHEIEYNNHLVVWNYLNEKMQHTTREDKRLLLSMITEYIALRLRKLPVSKHKLESPSVPNAFAYEIAHLRHPERSIVYTPEFEQAIFALVVERLKVEAGNLKIKFEDPSSIFTTQ